MKTLGILLVVDDSRESLKMLEGSLSGAGYTVRLADSGELGLAIFQASTPDLVLLDLKMPGLDGLQVLQRIREVGQEIPVPVIIMSGLSQPEERARALASGAMDFVTKPFRLDELQARVKVHLDLYRARCELVESNQHLQAETERARTAERRQREILDHLDLVLHTSQVGVYDLDLVTGVAQVSPEYLEGMGLDPAEGSFTSQDWLERLHPEDRASSQETVDKCAKGELQTYQMVYRVRHEDGSYRWIHSQGGVMALDGQGKPTRLAGTHLDITDRKWLEEQLVQASSDWRATFDALQDVIWVLDRDSRILKANQATQEVFGLSIKEVLGKHCWEVAHQDALPIPGCPGQRALLSGQRETLELTLGSRDFQIVVDPVLQDDGQVVGLVHVIRDITEYRAAQKLLTARVQELHRWHEATLGREGRILELKQEVNDLLERLGEPLRYGQAALEAELTSDPGEGLK